MHGSFIPYSVLLIFHALNFASINFRDYKKNSSKSVLNFTTLSVFLFYFKNPEPRARVTKNKEILERYKCLVQSTVAIRSLQMETLMTVLKRFWPNYQLKKTVNRRKSASRKQDRKDVLNFKDR